MLPLNKNMEQARLVVEDVKRIVKHGADNKSDSTKFARKWVSRARNWYQTPWKNLYCCFIPSNASAFRSIKIDARSAELFGVGNCGEQSALAFTLLHQRMPNAMIEALYIKGNDHAFTLIDRAKSHDVKYTSDYSQWSPNAVVCDPWLGIHFYGFRISAEFSVRPLIQFDPKTQSIVRNCVIQKNKYNWFQFYCSNLPLSYKALFFIGAMTTAYSLMNLKHQDPTIRLKLSDENKSNNVACKETQVARSSFNAPNAAQFFTMRKLLFSNLSKTSFSSSWPELPF